MQVALLAGRRARTHQLRDQRLHRRREAHRQRHERRRLRGQRHRHGTQLPADRHHPRRRLRRPDARLGQHLEAVPAQQPGDGGLAAQVGRAGEAGRELAGEQLGRRGAPGRRHDQREHVALPEDPGVDDDHPLGREQRAVDQAAVAGLLEVVREQPLQAGERARPGDAEHRRRRGDHRGPVPHPVQAPAIEAQVELSHGPRAARTGRGR